MGIYTGLTDPAIDAHVDRDLARIVATIRAELHDVECIILVGSFSRGEGSVSLRDGLIAPLNDYDLVVVRPAATRDEGVRSALKGLAPSLGFDHLDVELCTRGDLARGGAAMHGYDMRAAGRVLFGDPEFLARLPPVPASAVDVVAAHLLLFNRLTCLLQGLPDDFPGAELRPQQALAVAYMVHKTVLAVAAARLAACGAYHHGLVERASRFERLFAADPMLVKLVGQATRFKLHPPDVVDDPVPAWFAARDASLAAIREVTSACYSLSITTWDALVRHQHRDRFRNLLRRLRWMFFDKKRVQEILAFERKQDVELAEIHVLAALRPDGSADPHLLSVASKLLSRWASLPSRSWHHCRAAVVALDLRYVHR